jgi:hypothetical protein
MSGIQRVSLPALGLYTDPGPFTATPNGAMVEAQNVAILRPGVIEPRPGGIWFKDATLKASGQDQAAIFTTVDGSTYVVAYGGGTPSWIMRLNASQTITGPSSFVAGKIRFAPTGGRVLLTSENGVCTLPNQPASPAQGNPTIAYRAGMPQPCSPTLSTTSLGSIPANSSIAYRVTLRRRLANGTVIESAPSSRSVITGGGSPFGVYFSGYIFPTDTYKPWTTEHAGTNPFGDLIAGDELCIYRSPTVTSPTVPSDEMKLRQVLPYNTTYGGFVDPQNPPAPWRDGITDAEWTGQALYTNATQEGVGLGNFRPQYARDIALYNDITFYAGAKSAQAVTLRNVSLGPSADGPQSTLTNYTFVSTCAVSSGSNVITGISAADMRALSVGQVLQTPGISPEANGAFPARTQIVSLNVGAGTATMSANSLVTNHIQTIRAWDWIQVEVDASTLRLYVSTSGAPSAGSGVAEFLISEGYAGAEQAWNGKPGSVWRKVQLRIAGPDKPASGPSTDGTWAFERTDCAGAAFVVKSSKLSAWDRPVNAATGVTSAPIGNDATLSWSKVSEPEHCPLPYSTVVGDAASPIRRIVVARQSLLIFKDDGLWAAYGDDPASISFEAVDSTIVLPSTSVAEDQASKWVGRFGDRVFAMTTRGPMLCTDSGGTLVGAPILESLRREFQFSYGVSDNRLRAMLIDTQARRVGFILRPSSGGSVAWVLDVEAGTWVYWTWSRPIADCSVSSQLGLPSLAAPYAFGYLADLRTMLDDGSITTAAQLPFSCEQWASETCTVLGVVDNGDGFFEVTIAAGSEWSPVVGDVIRTGSLIREVTSVDSPTVFYTRGEVDVGSASWRESLPIRCMWAARDEGDVGVEKTWTEVSFPFELGVFMAKAEAIFSGYRNATLGEVSDPFNDETGVAESSVVPRYIRAIVPHDLQRDWALRVGFAIRRACLWFSTAGLVARFNVGSSRVTR